MHQRVHFNIYIDSLWTYCTYPHMYELHVCISTLIIHHGILNQATASTQWIAVCAATRIVMVGFLATLSHKTRAKGNYAETRSSGYEGHCIYIYTLKLSPVEGKTILTFGKSVIPEVLKS